MEKEPNSGKRLDEKPFLEHLEDLRWMFINIIFFWGAASLIAFVFAPRVLAVVEWPLLRMLRGLGRAEAAEYILRSLSPAEVFLMSIRLSLLAGAIISLPFILYFPARFILPALNSEEKKFLLPSFAIGGGLFFGGVLFAYVAVLPLTLRFFWRFSERLGVQPAWTVNYYAALVVKLLIAFGLAFELPVVILLLVKLGIVDYDMLRRKRPYVILTVFVAAALLTPPDVISQVLLAIPLLLLFEICVFLSKFVAPRRAGPQQI